MFLRPIVMRDKLLKRLWSPSRSLMVVTSCFASTRRHFTIESSGAAFVDRVTMAVRSYLRVCGGVEGQLTYELIVS